MPTIKQAIWDWIERSLREQGVEDGSPAMWHVSTLFDRISEPTLISWFYETAMGNDEDAICDALGESLGAELIDRYSNPSLY